jgi:RNA polymerase sigma-70 factor, ECF subfamily
LAIHATAGETPTPRGRLPALRPELPGATFCAPFSTVYDACFLEPKVVSRCLTHWELNVQLEGQAGNWYFGYVMDGVRSLALAVGRDQTLGGYNEQEALVAELQAGSEAAFTYLLGVYQNPVFNMIAHILGNDEDAADVLQDVFVKVFKGVRQFHGDSSLKTWIYRIAVHEALNHRRSWLRRRLREVFSLDGDSAGGAPACERRVGSNTPYQVLEQSERQELVKRAVASLAEPYKTVVVLREIEDMSYEEIAVLLGIAEGTVKSRLMRGRELLRRKLAGVLGR